MKIWVDAQLPPMLRECDESKFTAVADRDFLQALEELGGEGVVEIGG
jgi:predicted nuclease of predicted toxin-antitoxin system